MKPAAPMVFLVCCAALCSAAQAGRPLQTEDAGVLPRGGCELEGAAQRSRVYTATAREDGLTGNCGVGLSMQAGLTLSRASSGGDSTRGLSVDTKAALWRAGGDVGAGLTLAVGVAGDHVAGQWRHSGRYATLVASVPAGPGTIHLNLSHEREREPRRTVSGWNLAWEHDGYVLGATTLAPMAEVLGNDRGDTFWNVALRATLVPDRFFIDASYGRQQRIERARLLTVGFKIAF